MKVRTSRPFGMASSESFVGMGVITDSGKDYLCFIDTDQAKSAMETHKKHTTISIASECCYVEEVHYVGRNKTLETASLHQIDNDEEWGRIAQYIMTKTDIFSPKKIKNILKHGVYFYSEQYFTNEETKKDVIHREKEGIL